MKSFAGVSNYEWYANRSLFIGVQRTKSFAGVRGPRIWGMQQRTPEKFFFHNCRRRRQVKNLVKRKSILLKKKVS